MTLQDEYPWTTWPLTACAPMRLIALSSLAVAVSQAGGLGFIGAGSDTSILERELKESQRLLALSPISKATPGLLPIGVGFLCWGANLEEAVAILSQYPCCAVWLFAARSADEMLKWTNRLRQACPKTQIWIQVGTVAEALELTRTCKPDVLVVQGTDAGGHGLTDSGASLITLLPETIDALKDQLAVPLPTIIAAGGIADGRGIAAAIILGAEGVTLGTRFLACPEANIVKGYQNAVLSAGDGGVNTSRSGVYDSLRGTTDWPPGFGGRGIINASYRDAKSGMSLEENKKLYEQALKAGDAGWGDKGRLTTYAGTNVGLIKTVKPAAEVVKEVSGSAYKTLYAHNRPRARL